MSSLIYTSRFENVSITAAAQDIWEIVTGNAAIVLRKIVLDFSPTITSGVAQDERCRLELLERSTTGTGGTAVTPAGAHPRMTVASLTTTTRTVTTPGTAGDIKWSMRRSIIMPIEIDFPGTLGIPVQASSGRLCLNLVAALSGAFNANSTIVFEEF
jgi:hypothetical protein